MDLIFCADECGAWYEGPDPEPAGWVEVAADVWVCPMCQEDWCW